MLTLTWLPVLSQREYTAYVSQKIEKRQSAISTLNEHNQQELQKLCAQKELEEEKHAEQANGTLPANSAANAAPDRLTVHCPLTPPLTLHQTG